MNAQEFREDQLSENVDPLHDSHQEFDFEAVDLALGCKVEDLDAVSYERLGDAIGVLIRWMTSVKIVPGAEQMIAKRVIATAWVLDPSLFGGVSQAELGRLFGFKTKMDISRHAAEFKKLFGVRNRGQSHAWNLGKEYAPRSKPSGESIINTLPVVQSQNAQTKEENT